MWYNNVRTRILRCVLEHFQDEEQWIPTYEDLLREASEITDAGYETYQQLDCIYAQTKEDDDGYAECYWVSVDTGLLELRSACRMEMRVYRMEGLEVSVSVPDAALFTLPDGTALT